MAVLRADLVPAGEVVKASSPFAETPPASCNHGGMRRLADSTSLLICSRRSWRARSSALEAMGARVGRRRQCARAMQADDLPPSEMSLEIALQILGVHEGASFDEILRAKKAVIANSDGDQERLMQVEAAYDILLMQSLSKRRAGNVIDNSVKYADVRRKSLQSSSTPQWLQSTLKFLPVSFESPSSQEMTVQAAVFGALAAWTFVGGLSQGGDYMQPSGSDVPGVQLALGFGASLYFLRKQAVKMGKAVLLTSAALAAGAIIGSGVEAWLQVDVFPVLGISSPAVVISEFSILSLWLASAYVR
eukprot:TRINITY_DN1494_c0_g1_i1.p1 TRINITY_DN1494_c0_g1~~TRINITY_DN1494_c0_g1_i1.p1  ORF type:complete len:347 (-),score=53.05 TRINITY_DN1494_c0_g1_i1:131-1042(-)